MTYIHPKTGTAEIAERRRREAGQILADMRRSVDKTQKDIAKEIGIEYYTMISQIESGKVRLPPAQIIPFAQAVQTNRKKLAKMLLYYYEPEMYEALFDRDTPES